MYTRTLKYLCIILLAYSCWAKAVVSCDMNVTPLNFGNYDPLKQNNSNSNGSIAVKCAGPGESLIAFTIKITSGKSGVFSYRFMSDQDKKLIYNIYLDPMRTAIWGDGTGGSSVLHGSCRAWTTCHFPVYGVILRNSSGTKIGNYTDNIQYILETKQQ